MRTIGGRPGVRAYACAREPRLLPEFRPHAPARHGARSRRARAGARMERELQLRRCDVRIGGVGRLGKQQHRGRFTSVRSRADRNQAGQHDSGNPASRRQGKREFAAGPEIPRWRARLGVFEPVRARQREQRAPGRRRALQRLRQGPRFRAARPHGELCAGAIVGAFRESQQRVRQGLCDRRAARTVELRRAGRLHPRCRRLAQTSSSWVPEPRVPAGLGSATGHADSRHTRSKSAAPSRLP